MATNDNKAQLEELNTNQLLAIPLLVGGMSQTEVAEQLGLEKATLSRWKQLPDFLAALNQARLDAYERDEMLLNNMRQTALNSLAELMQHQNERIRLAAIQTFLMHHKPLPPDQETDPDRLAERMRLEDEEAEAALAHKRLMLVLTKGI